MEGQTASVHLTQESGQGFQGYVVQATQKRKQSSVGFLVPAGLDKALQEQMWFQPARGEKPKEFLRWAFKAFHTSAKTFVSTSLIELFIASQPLSFSLI